WSVTLDSQPIEVRRTSGKYIIPLPAGGSLNRQAGEHQVVLLYETQLVSPSAVLAAQGEPGDSSTPQHPTTNSSSSSPNQATGLNHLLPQTVRQAAPVVNMTVLQLSWNVHLPNGTVLVSSDGDFRREFELTRPSLVGFLRQAIAENSVQDLSMKLTLF